MTTDGMNMAVADLPDATTWERQAQDLLVDLVRQPSVNPEFPGVNPADFAGGEEACNRILAERLTDVGMENHWVTAVEGRGNLVSVRAGTGSGRSLILNGHIDTVAPIRPDTWQVGDPFAAEVRDDVLHGLGSTDMKSGLAAIWLALKSIDEAGIRLAGDVQVHSVVGEETMSHEVGTSAVLAAGFTADAAIVTEPTSDPAPVTVCNISGGNFNVRMTARGRATHCGNRFRAIRDGQPGDAVGVNAVEKIVDVVRHVQGLERQWGQTKTHKDFPAGFFSMLPGVIHGDVGYPSPAYFADEAYVQYLGWYPPDQAFDDIRHEIEQYVRSATANDPWLADNPIEFDWVGNWPPTVTDPGHGLVTAALAARSSALESETFGSQQTPSYFGAVCDTSFLEAHGIPGIVCGPGDLRFAHARDEQVHLPEVTAAAQVLIGAIVDWCGIDRT